nr:DUF3348 domain-containing protein [Cupriavidus gilardii]
MLQVPTRAPSSGPTLIRLLARLTEVEAPEPGRSLAAELGQWLGWTDAVALSSALNGGAQPATSREAVASEDVASEDVARDCARVRAALAKAINDNGSSASRSRAQTRVQPPGDGYTTADYAIHRQRYLSLQQSMETPIAALRGRLRALLSAQGADMARLAAVDAVMERVLGAREQALLIAVPSMLEAHFERLRQAGETAQARDQRAPAAWLRAFRDDMRAVLLAELDIRFQPVEGLLAALRAS